MPRFWNGHIKSARFVSPGWSNKHIGSLEQLDAGVFESSYKNFKKSYRKTFKKTFTRMEEALKKCTCNSFVSTAEKRVLLKPDQNERNVEHMVKHKTKLVAKGKTATLVELQKIRKHAINFKQSHSSNFSCPSFLPNSATSLEKMVW